MNATVGEDMGKTMLSRGFNCKYLQARQRMSMWGSDQAECWGLSRNHIYVQVKSILNQNKRYASLTSHFWTCHEDWQFMTMTQCNFPVE